VQECGADHTFRGIGRRDELGDFDQVIEVGLAARALAALVGVPLCGEMSGFQDFQIGYFPPLLIWGFKARV
jgi:hypothetical protein